MPTPQTPTPSKPPQPLPPQIPPQPPGRPPKDKPNQGPKPTVHAPLYNKAAEHGGPKGPEPTRYGDWEQNGRCSDF